MGTPSVFLFHLESLSLRHPKPLTFLFCLNKLSYLPSQSWNLSSTQTTRSNQSIPQNVISTNYNRSQCPLRSSSTTTHRLAILTRYRNRPSNLSCHHSHCRQRETRIWHRTLPTSAATASKPSTDFPPRNSSPELPSRSCACEYWKYQMATPLGSLQQGPAPV